MECVHPPARSRPKMKRGKMLFLSVGVVVLGLGAMAAVGGLNGKKKDGPKAVAVVRGSLVDKALAVGTIQPRVEVSVKSMLSGVVQQRFAGVGDWVKKGQALLEIAPNPTPLEIVSCAAPRSCGRSSSRT